MLGEVLFILTVFAVQFTAALHEGILFAAGTDGCLASTWDLMKNPTAAAPLGGCSADEPDHLAGHVLEARVMSGV